jgi:hypothetical protein
MRGKVFTLASVALLSCRAVLGIEDLQENKDGGTTADGGPGGKDAGPDTTPAKDGSSDTGSDASGCSGQVGPDCGKCCRDSNMLANKNLEDSLKAGSCLCTAECSSECGSNLCTGGDPAGTECPKCIDTVIKANKCSADVSSCEKSADCKVLTDCIRSCQ